jgi:integrase
MKGIKKETSTRKVLAEFGVGTDSHIRLAKETRATRTGSKSKYIARYGKKFARRQKSWPCTAEGRAEAEAYVKQFDRNTGNRAANEPLATQELWSLYLANAKNHLSKRSIALYKGAWDAWERHRGANSPAEFGKADIGNFRSLLESRNLATATMKMTIQAIRIVYKWAETNELISRNRWNSYQFKVAKNRRTKRRDEYRGSEGPNIWKALNPKLAGQWRAWVAVGLLLAYGFRQNEILQLQWSWIDDDFIKIPSEFVKNGDAIERKLFPLVRSILQVAWAWRERLGYDGPYVLFSGKVGGGRKHEATRPYYSIQTLTNHIHNAERRAHIASKKWRAGHGFRRGLVGDVAEATHDIGLALQAIGDKDMRMAINYRVPRNDKIDIAIRERADRMFPDGGQPINDGATTVQPTPKKRVRRGSKKPGADSATP